MEGVEKKFRCRGGRSLEIINAVHALWFRFGKYKTAKRRSKILSARAMRHSPKTGAIPIDLARLFIERALLGGFVLFSLCLTLLNDRFESLDRSLIARGGRGECYYFD